MSPEEFIRQNLLKELDRLKVPFAEQDALANEGLRFWRESSRFKKGAWQETLSYVKKRIRK